MKRLPGLSTALALTLTTACGDPASSTTEAASDSQTSSNSTSSASFPTSTVDPTGNSGSDSATTDQPTSGANASGASDSTSTSTTANSATDTGTGSDTIPGTTTTTGDTTVGVSDTSTGSDTSTSTTTGDNTTTTTTGETTGGNVECGTLLDATIRDFSLGHPDFEDYGGNAAYKGLVKADLGPDMKPAYANPGPTPQTSGPDAFKQWYNDTPGVNQTFQVQLNLTEIQPGLYQYKSDAFFPVDGKGFGNEGLGHNFAFTTEIHTQFIYNGGEKFTFTGDDDLWMFINNKLAIDLGGLHPPLSDTVDLDAAAAMLGIAPGQTYKMDIFHAERHSDGSNFRIDTTIGCFVPQ
jgi:fibro-slime domain-containing protein